VRVLAVGAVDLGFLGVGPWGEVDVVDVVAVVVRVVNLEDRRRFRVLGEWVCKGRARLRV